MDNLLLKFINDPYNDTINFELAYSYEEIGQTASALSYYLRCAEFTKNDDLAYECLIRMSLCLSKQGTRETMELICIQHALSIRPDRPEANYLMSLYYSYREKWLESYMFACNGLINNNNELVLRKEFIYFDNYQLLFQKAYSGFHKGKLKESYKIYQELLTDDKINDNYRTIISNNLKNYPENMKKNEFKKTLEKDENQYTVNNYHGNEDGYFYIYKNCPISKDIRNNIIWEKYIHELIEEYVTKDSICVEIGSHIGTCSVKLSKMSKYLYCFEPLIESYDLLCKNIVLNQCTNVSTYNMGISDKNKSDYLNFISYNNPGGSGLIGKYHSGYENSNHYLENVHELKNEYPIQLKTLDSFNLGGLDFLKVDVEGYEENVFDGAMKTIQKYKPIIIFESYKDMIHFQKLSDIEFQRRFKTILDFGYEYQNIYGHDYLLIPKKQKIGVDVGACIGETIDYFKDYDLIYAIEPSPEEFNILKEKYENDKRIIPIQCAISDKDGEEILNCYENGRFSSFLEFNKDGNFYDFCEQNVERFDTLKERINVQTIRLDTFINKYKIDHIDYLKIDTQGTDLKVVQSLGDKLCNVDTIQMEVQLQELYKNSFTKDEIVKYMNDNNFKLIDTSYGEISKEYEQDFIFKNNKKSDNNIKMIINKNIELFDIVLQGKYNENVIPIAEYYLELDFVNNIIISCWEGDNVPEITNDRIIVMKNEVPQQIGSGNKNLQIISSLNGLKKAETEFAIKIRNDQRYTHESMNKMYTFYEEYKEKKLSFYYDQKKPKNRICVSGNFAEFSFHPRDHLFWGNREDLIDLFALPLDTWAITDKIKFIQPEDYALYYEHFIRSETYIGAHYLANFNRMINYYLLDPKKYLYDNSEKYYETKKLSDQLTPQVFKSFPREGIDLEWYKYGWKTYPYDIQRDNFGERWHEDGL
tara:strand:+ start:2838 stop:5621 length:2784 start_codon:yes stop_codon:yes gene_type:complete